MPENLYPQLPTAPPISQESFNIEMVRKYYQDIANLKEQYTEKQRKYKNTYNRLLHASTGASSVALVGGVSTIQSQKTQGFCVADFAMLSDERRSRSKIFPLFIWIKEPCVRKFEGLERAKLLGISQTISEHRSLLWDFL